MPSTWPLPLEIMENILLRLPVKSVIRFKCVCKAWHSLISDPYFVKAHLHQPQTQARSHFCMIAENQRFINVQKSLRSFTKDCDAFSDDVTGEPMAFDYYFPDIGHFDYPFKLLDSCDGLSCIIDFYGKIVLWNPSTRKHHQLPRNPNIDRDSVNYCYGFGYDSLSDDYKVIAVSGVRNVEETTVDVFSLKCNKWKRIQEKRPTVVVGVHATVLRGAVHWVAAGVYGDDDPIRSFYRITAFDFEKEKFRDMSFPNDLPCFKLGTTGGCLCAQLNYDPSMIWVMTDYGINTSWTITSLYAGSLSKRREWDHILFKCELLHTLNDVHLLLVDWQELTLYHHKENTYKYVMPYDGEWYFKEDANLYTETLVSPHPSPCLPQTLPLFKGD